jgi:predicted NBD/HSP70 family sugar kinase
VHGQKYSKVSDPSGGSNQSRVRAYNERLVLSLVRRHGSLPKSEIARRSGLSAQTVSVIMRALENDALLLRGEPQRGRVGQPSIPMSLDPSGVYSIGLKIGRRSAELTLVDFLGREIGVFRETYEYPLPQPILDFTLNALEKLTASLDERQLARIAGIGVAMPFELWSWAEKIGAPSGEMEAWRGFDFRQELENLVDFPIYLENDATSACGAELVFGRGAEYADFVYFFVGTFIGGGIVLNHSVYNGRTGNAGALGSIPVYGPGKNAQQLIDQASVHGLETRLRQKGIDPSILWRSQSDWSGFDAELDEWINTTAEAIAFAIAACCSVIDFETAIVDGGFPAGVRRRLVEAIRGELGKLDLQGIVAPEVVEGLVGSNARAIGAATLPLFARYLLDQNVLFKETAQAE